MEEDHTPFRLAKLMDELRQLMFLALEASPAAMNQLESLMHEMRETRAVAIKHLEASERSATMQEIEVWAEVIDSSEKPIYH